MHFNFLFPSYQNKKVELHCFDGAVTSSLGHDVYDVILRAHLRLNFKEGRKTMTSQDPFVFG